MKSIYILVIILFINNQLVGQYEIEYLTHDGAWCWFSDPRAILVDDYVIAGWVKADGTIESVKFDTVSRSIKTHDLYHRLEGDDHNNPAFVLNGKDEVLAMYTRHSKKDLFINVLKDYENDSAFSDVQFIHPMSKKELQKFPKEQVTYANPIRLKSENDKIFCFGRWTGYKPNMMSSNDDGATWSKSKVFITNYPFDDNNRPYVKYFSDGDSKIHIVFTDGHPRAEPTNSVYYAHYENGAFYKADGQEISDMNTIPFEPKEASVVYTSNEVEGRAWIADIGQDEHGNPVILYTRSPSEHNHEYWYARYSSAGWSNNKLCDSGKSFPQTPAGKIEKEPHYFGGMTIHPNNCNVLYISRQIEGVFEIERWETYDQGDSWNKEAVTKNSSYDNVRPFIPRELGNASSEIVLWMENQEYIHYTDYKTSIKYLIRKK
jgi:hypothetical protein